MTSWSSHFETRTNLNGAALGFLAGELKASEVVRAEFSVDGKVRRFARPLLHAPLTAWLSTGKSTRINVICFGFC